MTAHTMASICLECASFAETHNVWCPLPAVLAFALTMVSTRAGQCQWYQHTFSDPCPSPKPKVMLHYSISCSAFFTALAMPPCVA